MKKKVFFDKAEVGQISDELSISLDEGVSFDGECVEAFSNDIMYNIQLPMFDEMGDHEIDDMGNIMYEHYHLELTTEQANKLHTWLTEYLLYKGR